MYSRILFFYGGLKTVLNQSIFLWKLYQKHVMIIYFFTHFQQSQDRTDVALIKQQLEALGHAVVTRKRDFEQLQEKFKALVILCLHCNWVVGRVEWKGGCASYFTQPS